MRKTAILLAGSLLLYGAGAAVAQQAPRSEIPIDLRTLLRTGRIVPSGPVVEPSARPYGIPGVGEDVPGAWGPYCVPSASDSLGWPPSPSGSSTASPASAASGDSWSWPGSTSHPMPWPGSTAHPWPISPAPATTGDPSPDWSLPVAPGVATPAPDAPPALSPAATVPAGPPWANAGASGHARRPGTPEAGDDSPSLARPLLLRGLSERRRPDYWSRRADKDFEEAVLQRMRRRNEVLQGPHRPIDGVAPGRQDPKAQP